MTIFLIYYGIVQCFMFIIYVCMLSDGYFKNEMWPIYKTKYVTNGRAAAQAVWDYVMFPVFLPLNLSYDFFKWCKKQ